MNRNSDNEAPPRRKPIECACVEAVDVVWARRVIRSFI